MSEYHDVPMMLTEVYNTLLRYAVILTRNSQKSLDLTQDTCLNILRHADTYNSVDGASFTAWAKVVMRNIFINNFRRHLRSMEDLVDGNKTIEDFYAEDLNVDEPTACVERLPDYLYEAIQAVPEAYRETVILRDTMGLKYEDIAEMMNVPIGTVRSRLVRGREFMQAHLLFCKKRKASWKLHTRS